MGVLKFIWYCIKCMFKFFAVAFGSPLRNFTWKEELIGIITLIVIITIILIILRLTGVIKFKK